MSSHGKKGPTGRERRRRLRREAGLPVVSWPVQSSWDDGLTDVNLAPGLDKDPLVELREIADMRREFRVAERELIDELREAGVSWSDIGGALGMSGPGALQRRARL